MGATRQAPGTLPRGRALMLSSATTITVVAWGVLVFAAIDFGRSARSGQGLDWLWLALATLGGIACMFAALVLASRMQNMIRLSARSSTRPLPRTLQDRPAPEPSTRDGAHNGVASDHDVPAFAEVPGRPAATRVRRSSTGKRAVRR